MGRRSATFLLLSGMLALAGPSAASGPPFGLPGSAPPLGTGKGLALGLGKGIGKGIGRGKGAAVANVSYHCLGYAESLRESGSAFSYLADSIVLDAGAGSSVALEGEATGDLVEPGVTAVPVQGAAAGVDTAGLALRPYDLCASASRSVLDSLVVGSSASDPAAYGVAEVDFVFRYEAVLELQDGGSDGAFYAFTETSLEVLGLTSDSFRVGAHGEVVESPPGMTVTDLSEGGHHVYEVSGTYVVQGRLFYGPGVANVVQTTFLAGGEVEGLHLEGARIVAGFAAAEALDSLSYEIVSVDPDVTFELLPAVSE